ncbi:MAG: type I restriction endonuclease subunit R [Bacilli bacterium]|nr:type I restriction endonuclease subunit R [Bacilli bacterium]
MSNVSIMSENDNSTVLTDYQGLNRTATFYQSEEELEKELIKTLVEQGYEYIILNSEDELILNLRRQIEKLNNFVFTDGEWDRFFTTVIANKNDYIVEKTRLIQDDYIQTFEFDNGKVDNIKLIDKKNVHNNSVQVINQYVNDSGTYSNRYDVTILVNGFPLVHCELKRRGVNLREAFNQIVRYDRDSFWSGNGLFNYIQIYVISNGTLTKYYSNTTREYHLNNKELKKSNSYEFTSYWADQKNKGITDLIDFAKTFLTKHTLLNVLTKYCVFTSEQDLLVMRPYQIVATEKILNRINIAYNNKFYGTIKAGGYIWHTTGSGKTLTSFKTSILASKLPFIDKVLFVVDRKDLDYQTMKEYDRFKEGCANSNTSTKVLEEQLNDPNAKIIITTIQKLSGFVKKNIDSDVYNKDVVFIFDECHRSQFGEMHSTIVKKFKKYYIFGFTGTPIFPENAQKVNGIPETTEQVFGDRLHTYTIVNAIADKNVLPFRYEFVQRVDIKDGVVDEKVYSIDEEKAFDNPARIMKVTDYIIKHFSTKTKTNESYLHSSLDNVVDVAKRKGIKEIKSKKNVNGFNSIFATSNIQMAKEYYEEFKRQQKELNTSLKIALIYSYGVNGEDGVIDENSETTEALSIDDRRFLDDAIVDYNKMFGTSYDTSSDRFQNYYRDVSLRMKNREIDILIVANMFLTGFDAKTLNTLWVDKNLKWHGLIQAFSRTNRILNSVKTFGNIVSFRNLEDRLNEALAKFGDENARGIVLLRPYKDYYYGYQDDNGKQFEGYKSLIEKMQSTFVPGEIPMGESLQKEYIKLYGMILKVTNILSAFDQFKDEELLTERDKQDYQSVYIDLYNDFRNKAKHDKKDITDDIVFEMELVKSIEVNIDYILGLVKKYHDSRMEDKEVLVTINKAIMASPDLRNKKDLIMAFIESLDVDSDVYSDFENFMNSKKKEELDKIISEESLDEEQTYRFIERAFEQGKVETNGTEISNLLPAMDMFSIDNDRQKKKNVVIDKLMDFFDKFFNITGNRM